jgi:hypothetical protein
MQVHYVGVQWNCGSLTVREKKLQKRMHLMPELSELRYRSNKQLIVVHMETEQEKNRFRKPSHESIHSTMDFSESTCS